MSCVNLITRRSRRNSRTGCCYHRRTIMLTRPRTPERSRCSAELARASIFPEREKDTKKSAEQGVFGKDLVESFPKTCCSTLPSSPLSRKQAPESDRTSVRNRSDLLRLLSYLWGSRKKNVSKRTIAAPICSSSLSVSCLSIFLFSLIFSPSSSPSSLVGFVHVLFFQYRAVSGAIVAAVTPPSGKDKHTSKQNNNAM